MTFEGIVGYSFTGDIAIDDVTVSSGSCSRQTPPPTWHPALTTLKPSLTPNSSNNVTTQKPSMPGTCRDRKHRPSLQDLSSLFYVGRVKNVSTALLSICQIFPFVFLSKIQFLTHLRYLPLCFCHQDFFLLNKTHFIHY